MIADGVYIMVVSVILIVIGILCLLFGARNIAGVTIRMATWLMIFCFIVAGLVLIFG